MKCFKSSFWLTAVCICEGAFYDDLCDVYVIFTRNCTGPSAGPPSSTVLIFMKRLLSNCLASLPLISIYYFPLTCLRLPATIQHLYLGTCTHPSSWSICPFINKDQLCHRNGGKIANAQYGGWWVERNYAGLPSGTHLKSFLSPKAAQQHCRNASWLNK